ncbi:MAG TPA: hypothetical protein PLI22_01120 [Caldisericia bacterium]|nr:hypothetical protein [Caldisericia bacterium]
MKIRTGFVSNSSSSSFILEVDKDIKDMKVKMEIGVDLKDLQDRLITSVDKLEEYFIDYYGSNFKENYRDESYIMKKYKKMKSTLDRGKNIFIGEVSNEDGGISAYIHEYGLPEFKRDGIRVIEIKD